MRQETREGTVGNGEQCRQGRRMGHSWQLTNESKKRGNSGGSDFKDEDAGFEFIGYLYKGMRWKRRTSDDLLQLTTQCGRSQHAGTLP